MGFSPAHISLLYSKIGSIQLVSLKTVLKLDKAVIADYSKPDLKANIYYMSLQTARVKSYETNCIGVKHFKRELGSYPS